MNKIKLLVFVVVLCTITFAQEYKATEMFSLPWGWENNQQLPYSLESDGMAFGPYLRDVDREGNIYLAFPYEDFRKYDSTGTIVYRNEIKVNHFAVDDSQNVYFTKLDPAQLHIVRILDKNGRLTDKFYRFSIDDRAENISWMKNRNGKVIFGNYRNTAEINNSLISSIKRQKKNPVDSRGRYYQSETAMRKSNRNSGASFNKEFVNVIIEKVSSNEIIVLDTIPLHVCRHPQQAAEIVEVDENDNIYVWLYYDLETPIDFVVLDSSFKEIDRIELVPIAESKGLWLRPYVMPDGTIYEFRDLDDGLHVIRWSRME